MTESPWIKCSEQLPEHNTDCWLYFKPAFGPSYIGYGTYINNDGIKEWRCVECGGYEFEWHHENKHITHWKPMERPAPPEVE